MLYLQQIFWKVDALWFNTIIFIIICIRVSNLFGIVCRNIRYVKHWKWWTNGCGIGGWSCFRWSFLWCSSLRSREHVHALRRKCIHMSLFLSLTLTGVSVCVANLIFLLIAFPGNNQISVDLNSSLQKGMLCALFSTVLLTLFYSFTHC